MTLSNHTPSHDHIEHYPQIEPASCPHCPGCSSGDTVSLGPVYCWRRLVERRGCRSCGEHFFVELENARADAGGGA